MMALGLSGEIGIVSRDGMCSGFNNIAFSGDGMDQIVDQAMAGYERW
jgi:hypothetical protein